MGDTDRRFVFHRPIGEGGWQPPQDEWDADDDARPQLCKWKHIEGSRISKDLFEHFTLPNGRAAYVRAGSGAPRVIRFSTRR